MTVTSPETETQAPRDFIRSIVAEDVAAGKHGGRVATRFPPEPNGYLHIGHAKAIVLSFGIARELGGTCNLRFDDTNPETEDPEFVASIEEDVRWLGYQWDGLFFASDYFERMYELAEKLVRDGKAYVDDLSDEEISDYRGTVTELGRPSPYRDRTAEENLDLFRRMRAGEFPDGARVLRAKVDLASPNMKMRDPLLYRIRHAHHHRTGDAWRIYPMYDWAHPLSDAFEGITHSLCTLEFENNREIYDWVVEHTGVAHRPQQIEFARLNLTYTVTSKRKLAALVKDGDVSGWDDPRMPTLAGLRRRGYTPEAIRSFCETIGVAKSNSTVDVAQLEYAVRDDLNTRAPRVLCVLRPLKLVVENWPGGKTDELDAPYWPHDVPQEGSRKLPFSGVLWIEQEDFCEEPPKKFHRLAPGREVRLRYGYVVRCTGVVKNDAGEVIEVRCTYDPETRGGSTPDGRKVPGTIHWVSADHAQRVEVRLYDRLFGTDRPDRGGKGEDFKTFLNPSSLEVLQDCWLEPAAADAPLGSRFQFERQGYFYLDPKATEEAGASVYNRIVGLKDSWAKQAAAPAEPAKSEPRPRQQAVPEPPAAQRPRAPEEEARFSRLYGELGVSETMADTLARDADLHAFFERGLETTDETELLASWVVNELAREVKGRSLDELPVAPRGIGRLVGLLAAGEITGPAAKEVFAEMLASGGEPEEIVERRGLTQMGGDALAPVVDRVVAAHPQEAEAYRGGKEALLGFFMGRLMQETRGRANPQLARELLHERLHS